jgi:hypothetical protein
VFAKKAKFLQMQLRTQARMRKNATKLADEYIAKNVGFYKPLRGETVLDRFI